MSVISFSLLLLIPSAVFLGRSPLFTQTKKAFTIEYFRSCDEHIYPANLVNFSFTRNGSHTIVNGVLAISRDLKTPLKLEFNITKCDDRFDKRTCKLFNRFNWPNFCDFSKLSFFPVLSTYYNGIQPPLVCPFKRDNYVLRNMKQETDVLTNLMPPNNRGMWIFRTSFWEDHQIIMCNDAAMRIANVRTRL